MPITQLFLEELAAVQETAQVTDAISSFAQNLKPRLKFSILYEWYYGGLKSVILADEARITTNEPSKVGNEGRRWILVKLKARFYPLVPAFSMLRACQEVNDSRRNAARTDLKGPFETRSILSGYVSRRPHATNDAKIDAPYCPAFQYAAVKRKEIWSHICTRLYAYTCVNT